MVCPDCAAGYEVPDQLLSGRKTVRCTRCGGSWAAAPEPLVAMAPLVSEPDAVLVVPNQPAGRPWALWASWAGSLAAAILFIALLLAEHRAIAAAWPPIQRLYGAIGLG